MLYFYCELREITLLTLDTDKDHSRKASTDAIRRLAQVIAFVRLLNVGNRQRAILNANVVVGANIPIVVGSAPCT